MKLDRLKVVHIKFLDFMRSVSNSMTSAISVSGLTARIRAISISTDPELSILDIVLPVMSRTVCVVFDMLRD